MTFETNLLAVFNDYFMQEIVNIDIYIDISKTSRNVF